MYILYSYMEPSGWWQDQFLNLLLFDSGNTEDTFIASRLLLATGGIVDDANPALPHTPKLIELW